MLACALNTIVNVINLRARTGAGLKPCATLYVQYGRAKALRYV